MLGLSLVFANLCSTTAKLPGKQSTQSCRNYQSKHGELGIERGACCTQVKAGLANHRLRDERGVRMQTQLVAKKGFFFLWELGNRPGECFTLS